VEKRRRRKVRNGKEKEPQEEDVGRRKFYLVK